MGIVHHGSYVAYLEVARVEWLRRRGVAYASWAQRGLHLAVVELSLRYRAPARFDDEIDVETVLGERRAASIRFDYRLLRAGDGVLLAEGSTRLACVDAAGRAQAHPRRDGRGARARRRGLTASGGSPRPVTNAAGSDSFELVGSVVDRQFRVDAVIGEGGFAVVYKGWHLSLDQPIALKALKMPGANDAGLQGTLLAKFREEAKLTYVLSQATLNIVRIIDFGATTAPTGAWVPFAVQEWLDGETLAQDLRRRRQQGMRGAPAPGGDAHPRAGGARARHRAPAARRAPGREAREHLPPGPGLGRAGAAPQGARLRHREGDS